MKNAAHFSLLSESEAFVRSLDDSPIVGRVIRGDADLLEYTGFLEVGTSSDFAARAVSHHSSTVTSVSQPLTPA